MVSILLIIAVAIPAIFFLLLWRYSYWYRRGVPQGNPLKLFGELNDLTVTSLPYFDHYVALSRKFKGIPFYGVYSLSRPRFIVRDPEMIKEVLTKKFSSFSENGFELDKDMEPIMGRDPFFQTGESWKESRNHFTSVMTPSRLRSMFLQMLEISKEAVKYLKDLKHESGKGDGTDVKDFSVRFMVSLLIRATLSVDAECFKEETSPFVETGTKVFDDNVHSFLTSIVFTIAPKLGPYLGIQMVPKTTTMFFDNVIKSQKEYRSKNGINREDLLDAMMKKTRMKTNTGAKEKGDPDLEILAMIFLFFVEGFETTSTGASGALVELARNSELQERLRRELLAACPPGQDITEEALNVPLLQHCFIESLRMYPPGILLQRVVTNDTTLEAGTGEQVFLKKGTYLNISLGGYHRDPEFFPDPDNFHPERFDDETQIRSFLGFGDGPRQCPGQKFAVLAGKTLLATILREFRLELSPKTSYPLKSINNAMMFALHDIWVRFIPL